MGRRFILLVEDNPDDEALTLRALRKHNISEQVVVAHDGVEALDFLYGTGVYAGRDTSVRPQVVLLDIKLPQVNGLEVLQRIRSEERTRCLPVVMLTSSGEEQDVQESYRLGANSYVRKPVRFDQFAEVAKQVAHYWLTLNTYAPPASV